MDSNSESAKSIENLVSDYSSETAGISNDARVRLLEFFNHLFSKPTGNPVPIIALLKHAEVTAVTTNIDIIRQVLAEVKSVTVTDDLIRSNVKLEQNTLILRDLPSDATVDDVIKIFSNLEISDGTVCPLPVNARSELNDTWFVTFAFESEARNALQALASSNAEFNGKKVKARLKTESLAKYQSTPSQYQPTFRQSVPAHVNQNPSAPPPPVYVNPTNYPAGVPPPMFGNQMMYPGFMFQPHMNMPVNPTNFVYTMPPQVAQGQIAFGPGPMQYAGVPQPVSPGAGNRQGYQNYPNSGYPNKYSGRGRNYRSNMQAGQSSTSSPRYRQKGPQDHEYHHDSASHPRGYPRNFGSVPMEPIQGIPFPLPQMFVANNGGFVNGYGDPIMQQQYQQQIIIQQQSHSIYDDNMELIASSSDYDGDMKGRDYIYLADSKQSRTPGKRVDNSETPSTSQDGPFPLAQGEIVDQGKGDSDEISTSDPPLDVTTNNSEYKGSHRGNYRGYNRRDRQSLNDRPTDGHYDDSRKRNTYGNGRGNGKSGSDEPFPAEAGLDAVNRERVDSQFNRRSHDRYRPVRKNDNDQSTRMNRKEAQKAPAPNFSESDFPTLKEDLPLSTSKEVYSESTVKGGYAAALKNTAIRPPSSTLSMNQSIEIIRTEDGNSKATASVITTVRDDPKSILTPSIDQPLRAISTQAVSSDQSIIEGEYAVAAEPVIIFGSFNGVSLDTQAKTIFGTESTVNGNKQSSSISVNSSANSNIQPPTQSDDTSSNANKRSFLDVLRAKTAA